MDGDSGRRRREVPRPGPDSYGTLVPILDAEQAKEDKKTEAVLPGLALCSIQGVALCSVNTPVCMSNFHHIASLRCPFLPF